MAFDPEVQKAQAYLRQLGYSEVDVNGHPKNLAVDGVSGEITQTALRKFQQDNDLPEGTPLSEMLDKMAGKIIDQPQQTAQSVQQTMAQGQGAGRDAVSTMQAIINLVREFLGLKTTEPLKVDGINGPKTREAYTELTGQPAPEVKAEAAPAAAAPQAPNSTVTEITIPAPSQAQPVIHAAPGADTQGITPVDGVIPTVVVGGADSPAPAQANAAPAAVPERAEIRAVNRTDPPVTSGEYRLGERGRLTPYHRQEAGRTGGPDYDYARPPTAAELRREEMQQRREAQELSRDTNRAIRGLGALTDDRRGNDMNAVTGLADIAMRRLFSP